MVVMKFLILLFLLIACAHQPRTLSGMHDSVGGEQSQGFQWVSEYVKREPDVWSSDFGFSTHPNDSFRLRKELVKKAILMSQKGKLITLSFHQCNPTLDEPCTFKEGVMKPLSSKEWQELLTPNSELFLRWKKQMLVIADYLTTLQDQGVIVYFRPYHEANLPSFWWGNASPENFIKLWHQTYQLFTQEKKLHNLRWVFALSFHPKYWDKIQNLYPGTHYVDVLGVDIYPPTKDGQPDFLSAWEGLKKIDPNKPLALSEVSRLPSPQELQKHHWFYFVVWGKNMLLRDNNKEEILKSYTP